MKLYYYFKTCISKNKLEEISRAKKGPRIFRSVGHGGALGRRRPLLIPSGIVISKVTIAVEGATVANCSSSHKEALALFFLSPQQVSGEFEIRYYRTAQFFHPPPRPLLPPE